MYQIDGRSDMLDRRIGKNPVPQVKDVSRPAFGSPENIFHSPFDFRNGTEQHDRIEVSLHCAIVTYQCPGFIERDSPINPDHIAARLPH